MTAQEYLFRKWQSQGLTDRENALLAHLAELNPLLQGVLETEWFYNTKGGKANEEANAKKEK